MKKIKFAVSLIVICCFLLSACGGGDESRDVLSIWCLSSDPLAVPASEFIEEYNSNLEKGLLPAELRLFSSENAMAEAFDSLRPDILICSETRFEALAAEGILRDAGSLMWDDHPEYPEYLSKRVPSAGSTFLPIGGSVQLICCDEKEVGAGNLETLSSLLEKAENYGAEKHLPFMTVDSFSAFFYQSMLSAGKEFHGEKLRDMKNDEYAEIYNLLAQAVYSGGLVCAENGGWELTAGGYLPCAAVESSSLSGRDTGTLKLCPMPGLGASSSMLSSLSGICVTAREGRAPDSAAAFLKALFSGCNAASMALSAGLVPLTPLPPEDSENSLSSLLRELSGSCELHLPESGSDYLENRGQFEHDFRTAMRFVRG